MSEISLEPVPQYYRMDPETEDLTPSGYWLREGMVVLIEDPIHRGRTDAMNGTNEAEKDRARVNNRWCRVSHLDISGPMLIFVGVYGDGTKRQRVVPVDRAWYYKIDSLAVNPVSPIVRFQGSEEDLERLKQKLMDPKTWIGAPTVMDDEPTDPIINQHGNGGVPGFGPRQS